ncbi:MAG: hypothetical protein OQL19_15365 [Gammaproteobacteria bacterium]|nr:hypothetical protein [Gammaproteobacteria bacterium]
MSESLPLVMHLRALGYTLNLTRFSLIILIAASALLFFDQGQDLLITIDEDGNYPRLIVSTFALAVSIWLWARVLMDIRFPYAPVSRKQLIQYRKYFPRILGTTTFVSVSLNLWRADASILIISIIAMSGVVFYLIVHYRRWLGQQIANKLSSEPESFITWSKTFEDEASTLHNSLWEALGLVRGWVAWAYLAVGVVLVVWGMFWPISMGNRFDALVLIFIWGATFIPIGSIITYYGNMKGWPLLSILIAMAAIFSMTNDNHQIRTLDGTSPAKRVTITEAITQWRDLNCKKIKSDGDNTSYNCRPFIVVATAGGGIRAAYWTGTVLGELHKNSHFQNQLFAISGVSGGSVGATVYRNHVNAGISADKIREKTQESLANDFLAPMASSLFYQDLFQRFVWWPLFPSRATTFEVRMEQSAPGLEKSFVNLNCSGQKEGVCTKPWPNLFLNSTWSDNGRRIVAAGLKPDEETKKGQPVILYKDLLNSLGKDMPRSTAAHNSARFPYVSPPGSWHISLPDGKERLQRLQDGGLFENFGAETALEILKTATTQIPGLKPLVILISSDPTLSENFTEFPNNKPIKFGYEIFSTPHTLLQTRTGRGAEAASRLKRWAENNGHFSYFRMCEQGGDRKKDKAPPLGWALSKYAQSEINEYLFGAANNNLKCPVQEKSGGESQACSGNQQSYCRIVDYLNKEQ